VNEELQFSALDRQFGSLVERLHGSPAPELRDAAMLVSRRRAEGHICIPAKNLPESCTIGSGEEFTPLVLDCGRLYLRRYWEYEQRLAHALLLRANNSEKQPKNRSIDRQEAAAMNALRRNFSVITGGPGTGKTHTVRTILQRLREHARGAELKIALAAPTGKAAARLTEALRDISPSVAATTIHRLLGTIPDSPYFRHNADRPLTADVVIVDEASMVDLALMAKLVDAVPLTSRLILLGDRDQLASVEAGNVLSDICAAAEADGSPLQGAVVELTKSYRFAQTGGIYALSTSVNAGDVEGAMAALRRRDDDELSWRDLPAAADLGAALREPVLAGYRSYLAAEADPAAALQRLQQFRILCAVRHGPFGVENVNSLVEQTLADAGLLSPRTSWYAGQPVIITRNDHHLQLFNGDSGIILPDGEAGGELRAFFLSAEGKLRRFLPSRLPLHETAFALTVHKSQGSEFDRLLVILPEKDSPVVTRELLYTAITRARSAVELWCNEEIFRAAVLRPTVRISGLRDALAAPRR
jgi:exodeoxyribonuclease V alpha subunit